MISIVQGDDKVLTFSFKNSTGTAYDLTGCTIFVTVKRNVEDADSILINTTLASSAPATGVATWTLVPADTKYMLGLYKMDIQIKTAAGKINTVLRDDFQVLDERTKRVS